MNLRTSPLLRHLRLCFPALPIHNCIAVSAATRTLDGAWTGYQCSAAFRAFKPQPPSGSDDEPDIEAESEYPRKEEEQYPQPPEERSHFIEALFERDTQN